MKLHSDSITPNMIQDAVPEGCYLAQFYSERGGGYFTIEPEPSRSRRFGYKVRMSGSSKSHMDSRNMPVVCKAATYEEWGIFLARLFLYDSRLIAGPYKGIEDFNAKTEHRFVLDDVPTI